MDPRVKPGGDACCVVHVSAQKPPAANFGQRNRPFCTGPADRPIWIHGPTWNRPFAGEKIMDLGALKLSIILFGLSILLKFQAWRHPAYRERLKEKNLTGQFIARDEEIGRWFKFT